VLTKNQRELLAVLAKAEEPMTTRQVAKALGLDKNILWTDGADAAHARLARLEKRGFVLGKRRRPDGTYGVEARWEIRQEGRDAIA
jgi:predicted ArsR family transcriptional regulator